MFICDGSSREAQSNVFEHSSGLPSLGETEQMETPSWITTLSQRMITARKPSEPPCVSRLLRLFGGCVSVCRHDFPLGC